MVMEKRKKLIIGVLVLIILFIPIVIDGLSNSILKTIEYKDLTEKRTETRNFEVAVVYIAPGSDDDVKEQKQVVKDIASEYKTSTNKDIGVYYMDYDKMTINDRTSIFDDSNEKTGYMFLVNGETTKIFDKALNKEELNNYIKFYSNNMEGKDIPAEMKKFNVAENAKAFQKVIKRKNDITMVVFGRDTCFYCNQFKIVYNTVAEEYDIKDIYYFDSDGYDKKEYEKVMNLGLKIPASCSKTKEELDLKEGFDTPLTLFTKNGKVIDCISEYSNKSSLVTKLKTVGMIGSN